MKITDLKTNEAYYVPQMDEFWFFIVVGLNPLKVLSFDSDGKKRLNWGIALMKKLPGLRAELPKTIEALPVECHMLINKIFTSKLVEDL